MGLEIVHISSKIRFEKKFNTCPSRMSVYERERDVQLSFRSFGSVKFSQIPWSFVVHRDTKRFENSRNLPPNVLLTLFFTGCCFW